MEDGKTSAGIAQGMGPQVAVLVVRRLICFRQVL